MLTDNVGYQELGYAVTPNSEGEHSLTDSPGHPAVPHGHRAPTPAHTHPDLLLFTRQKRASRVHPTRLPLIVFRRSAA